MANDKKKKLLQQRIKEFKERKKKVFGDPKITGVSRPKKEDPKEKRGKQEKEKRHSQKHPQPTVVGPRGGQYVETVGGKKQYQSKIRKAQEGVVKGLLGDIASENNVIDFIDKFKKERSE